MAKYLILLHGALGSKATFGNLKELLSTRFRVYDMDFEGHGGRASQNEFSIDLFSRNLLDFLDNEKIDKAHLFGYSMGGYVALDFARKHPDRVGAIVTLGTKFAWTAESAAQETRMLNPDKIQEKVPAFAERLRQLHAPNDWRELLHKTADMMLGLGNGKALTATDLAAVPHYVQVCVGELDHMVSQGESTSATDALPQGSLKILKGTKHPIEKVDKEMLRDMIMDYFYK